MIPDRLLDITVTWSRPSTGTDAYGNADDDWTTPTTSSIKARIQQRSSLEQQNGRDVTVTGLVLFTNQLGIEPVDRFVYAGDTYEVDGDPAVVHDRHGPHHSEVPLRRVVG